MNKKNIVTIELDKERHLRYTLNSMEILEDNIEGDLQSAMAKPSIKTMKVLLFAGLVHEDKELTIESVGDLIGVEDLERVSEAIGKAFSGLK